MIGLRRGGGYEPDRTSVYVEYTTCAAQSRKKQLVSISVAMATYNGARFLREQLDSIAAQTELPFELVVGDDASTDDTIKILNDFAKTAPFPVRLVQNQPGLGFGDNFITTARRCSGDWIAFCDQDDVWLPNKLETCLNEIACGPDDLRLIVHEAFVTDEMLQVLRKQFYFKGDDYPSLTLRPDWFCSGMAQIFDGRLIYDLPSSPRVCTSSFDFYEPHDIWISVLANATGTIRFLEEPLLYYRRHGKNTSEIRTHSFAEWVRLATENHGAHFAQSAVFIHQIGKRFQAVAHETKNAEFASRLRRSAEKTLAFSIVVQRRAEAYAMRSRLKAYARFIRLMREGAYAEGVWKFGKSRFFKDVISVTLARN